MTNSEIKGWAKEKIKGHILELFVPILVAGILTGLQIGQKVIQTESGGIEVKSGYPLGIFFFFVEVGLVSFMIKFITDQEHNFKDLFSYAKDYVRIFLVGLLRDIFIFLWTLLFIIPGILKAFSYMLVPMLLADEKYNTLGYRELLKKSEEMMKGHRMDYFILELSFLGWHILSIFTLGLLQIWIQPYRTTAVTKFLYDVKSKYENPNGTSEPKTNAQTKFCTNCGAELPSDSTFCPSCGQEIK